MRPVPIVTGLLVETHAGLPATSVTCTPGCGAATATPPLSRRIVAVVGKDGRSWSDESRIFRFAVVDTIELPLENPALLATTVEEPIARPRTVPLALNAPPGMVIVAVTSSTAFGSEVVKST